MGFFSFLVLIIIAYLLWRVTDQLPDLTFRLSEVQRDVAELRRSLAEASDDKTADTPSASAPSAAPTPAAPEPAGDAPADGDGN